MNSVGAEVHRLVADHVWEGSKAFADQVYGSSAETGFTGLLGPPTEFDGQPAAAFSITDFFDDEASETGSQQSDGSSLDRKRELHSPECGEGRKKTKLDCPDLFGELDCLLTPEGLLGWPDLPLDGFETPSSGTQHSDTVTQTGGLDFEQPTESINNTSGCSRAPEAADVLFESSAEYHFDQIQQHAKLAVAALHRGQYGHSKNIVTWAHDLKNKVIHELKKEAETAWGAKKDQERVLAPKPHAKKTATGTKRVEQFRKNMRRWMIGTQTGVEWMVYARMEHLVAIAKFILGNTLPADPASPTAVAESVNNYLQQQLPSQFIDSQLAEPEPGKRYVIGPGLFPLLDAKQPRVTQTLAFTMPSDGDDAAVSNWLSQLKSLFPKKPTPKAKAGAGKA